MRDVKDRWKLETVLVSPPASMVLKEASFSPIP